MVEVLVNKILNEKKVKKLLSFLHSLSSEICFSCFHQYHIDEDVSVEILNEYKNRCKERHHQLSKWYEQKEPFLMKVLSKLHIKTDDEFNEYKMDIFQNDMIICKKMDEALMKLQENKNVVDYKEVFSNIKDDFKEVETHMFDNVSISVIPLDYVVYNTSENLLNQILKVSSLFEPFIINEEQNIYLFNPVFCNNEEGFAAISSEQGSLTMILNEKDYKEFKKLKIRHKKDVVIDEKVQ